MHKNGLDLLERDKEHRLTRVSSAFELKKGWEVDAINSRINSIQNSIKNDMEVLKMGRKRF